MLNDTLFRFALAVKEGLLHCQIAEGLDELKENTKSANWLIVSGGDEAELRDVFSMRKLTQYFNGGIFGSPDTKVNILKREIGKNNITNRCLFLGDSKYDYIAASQFGLDFVFISQWTEVKGWEKFVQQERLNMFISLKHILL